jgi:hypothetical protein
MVILMNALGEQKNVGQESHSRGELIKGSYMGSIQLLMLA